MMMTEDVGTFDQGIMFSELSTGILLEHTLQNKWKLTVDPNYTLRMWEQEFGISSSFGKEKFGADLEVFTTDSDYWACPDKDGFNLGGYANLGKWLIKMHYGRHAEDYSGETDVRHVLSITGKISF